MRAEMSALPPGANPTISLIDLVGNGSFASDVPGVRPAATGNTIIIKARAMYPVASFRGLSPSLVSSLVLQNLMNMVRPEL
jgi:hypothetical protein